MLHLAEAPWNVRTCALGILLVWLAWAASLSVALVTILSLGLATSTSPPSKYLRALEFLGRAYAVLFIVVSFSSDDTLALILREPGRLVSDGRPRGCELTYQNLTATVDFYVLSHIFGHLVKGAMLRNRATVWISAFLFEAAEVILALVAPRSYGYLNECWWDRFLLDPICNFAGIELGIALAGGSMRWRVLGFWKVISTALVVAATDVLHFCLLTVLKVDIASPALAGRMLLYLNLGFLAARSLRGAAPGKRIPPPRTSRFADVIFAALAAEFALLCVLTVRGL